jgi:hypothetical protein
MPLIIFGIVAQKVRTRQLLLHCSTSCIHAVERTLHKTPIAKRFALIQLILFNKLLRTLLFHPTVRSSPCEPQ